jgi:hypothetical protein
LKPGGFTDNPSCGLLKSTQTTRLCRPCQQFSRGARSGFDRGLPVSHDINVLALAKGSERYLFLFNDTSRTETLRTLGRFASNPELSFSWYDAAILSQKIRAGQKPAAQPAPVTINRDNLSSVYDPSPNDAWDS